MLLSCSTHTHTETTGESSTVLLKQDVICGVGLIGSKLQCGTIIPLIIRKNMDFVFTYSILAFLG